MRNFIIQIFKKNTSEKKSNSRKIFTEIFVKNIWNSDESYSGTGSTIDQTKIVRQQLEYILDKYQIKSMLDIPCGDFNWMQKVKLDSIQYVGADIVKPVIKLNNKKYKHLPNFSFHNLDITKDKLPKVDLVFVRDCFVHLSYCEINQAINNIKKSNSKYLLTTTFVDRKSNEDSELGGWRTLNMQIEPFNFPKPILLINEECTEGDGDYNDKSLGLWLIDELKHQ